MASSKGIDGIKFLRFKLFRFGIGCWGFGGFIGNFSLSFSKSFMSWEGQNGGK
jgi:hypothetical protein